MSVHVCFHTTCETSADQKTSIINIKSIQSTVVDQDDIYVFPSDLQSISKHTELYEILVIKSGIKSLTRRGQYRNLKVTLPDTVASLYFDAEKNVCFKGNYLDKFVPPDKNQRLPPQSQGQATQKKKKSLTSLVKDMALEKFSMKSQNAAMWVTLFEKECVRMEVALHKYSEVLRLFLEGSAAEWFSLSLKLIGKLRSLTRSVIATGLR